MKIFGLFIHTAREEGYWSLYIHTGDDDWTFFRALTWNTKPEVYCLSLKGYQRLVGNLYWEW